MNQPEPSNSGLEALPVIAGAESWLLASPRLAAARRLLPATQSLSGLDEVAAVAARLLGTSSAQVSLLTDVQTVTGAAGGSASSSGSQGAAADSLCTVTAISGDVLAVTDAARDRRVAGLPPVRSGAVGSYLGIPLSANGGEIVGAVCVYDPAAREWSDADVRSLSEVAAAASAQLELSALSTDHQTSRLLLEVSLAAAGIGTFDLDVRSQTMTADDRLLELVGLHRESFFGSLEDLLSRVHVDDVATVTSKISDAVLGGTDFTSEFRLAGGSRWIAARGSTLRAADQTSLRMLGAMYDITLLREAGAHIEGVLNSMAVGYLAMDEEWRITYANAQAVFTVGLGHDALVGGVLWDLFPATVGSEFEAHYRKVAETGDPVSFDAYYPAPFDAWYEIRAIREETGVALYFLDITARKQAEEAAESARRRLQFLATVTAGLSESLDAEQAVGRLAALTVPELGDWCVVTLIDHDQAAEFFEPASAAEAQWAVRDVASAHRDPSLQPLVEQYARNRVSDLNDHSMLRHVLQQVTPIVVDNVTANVAATLRPGRALDALTELAPAFATIVPVRGRGRTIGLLSLFRSAERGQLTAEETRVATEVAVRAGMALDSARAYRQQRDIAEGLQRSLMTRPAQPNHTQIVVRYAAAAEAAQVGGDWYDAFLQPGGSTVLAIGDVVGHDTQAAAAMSQIRSFVRAFAAVSDAQPASVLQQTDCVNETLGIATTATAIVACLEQTSEEERAGLTRLRWSNAGHLPILVLDADGSVALLESEDPDLMLGVAPELARTEAETVLGRGATVLFYTDGLIERRGQDLQEGLDRLGHVVRELAASSPDLDSLVDGVLARLLPDRLEDDAAVIAVRLHRQDRARPLEAGPNTVFPSDEASEPAA